jgi:spore coat polysaccharide biosynthesis protein SpsF
MTTAAIIQARMGSTRRPGKVLADICGRPMLSHIVQRCQHIPWVDEVVIATTTRPEDRAIVDLASDEGVMVTQGNSVDVLRRVLNAARMAEADIVVRVCGDAPLFCPRYTGRLAWFIGKHGYDFLEPGPPSAYQGADVITREALELTWRLAADDPLAMEHVTAWAYRHPEHFKVGPQLPVDASMLGEYHLSVDTERDLEYIRGIYRRHWRPGGVVDLEEVVRCM